MCSPSTAPAIEERIARVCRLSRHQGRLRRLRDGHHEAAQGLNVPHTLPDLIKGLDMDERAQPDRGHGGGRPDRRRQPGRTDEEGGAANARRRSPARSERTLRLIHAPDTRREDPPAIVSRKKHGRQIATAGQKDYLFLPRGGTSGFIGLSHDKNNRSRRRPASTQRREHMFTFTGKVLSLTAASLMADDGVRFGAVHGRTGRRREGRRQADHHRPAARLVRLRRRDRGLQGEVSGDRGQRAEPRRRLGRRSRGRSRPTRTTRARRRPT